MITSWLYTCWWYWSLFWHWYNSSLPIKRPQVNSSATCSIPKYLFICCGNIDDESTSKFVNNSFVGQFVLLFRFSLVIIRRFNWRYSHASSSILCQINCLSDDSSVFVRWCRRRKGGRDDSSLYVSLSPALWNSSSRPPISAFKKTLLHRHAHFCSSFFF